jgi:hypothetical protein
MMREQCVHVNNRLRVAHVSKSCVFYIVYVYHVCSSFSSYPRCLNFSGVQVEAGHDLDIAEITTRITAPSIFVRLLLPTKRQ